MTCLLDTNVCKTIHVVQIPCGDQGPTVLMLNLVRPVDTSICRMFETSCSADRRAKAARYHRVDDRIRCLAAGWLVQYAAEQVLGMSGIHVSHKPGGCPFLSQAPGIFLSISHSGPWVVCALHLTGPVGNDVEQMPSITPGMAELFMSPEELAAFQQCSGEMERSLFFLRYWCLKESWLKAVGTGLMLEPSSVSILPHDTIMSVQYNKIEFWHIHEQWLNDTTLLTVCWK